MIPSVAAADPSEKATSIVPDVAVDACVDVILSQSDRGVEAGGDPRKASLRNKLRLLLLRDRGDRTAPARTLGAFTRLHVAFSLAGDAVREQDAAWASGAGVRPRGARASPARIARSPIRPMRRAAPRPHAPGLRPRRPDHWRWGRVTPSYEVHATQGHTTPKSPTRSTSGGWWSVCAAKTSASGSDAGSQVVRQGVDE